MTRLQLASRAELVADADVENSLYKAAVAELRWCRRLTLAVPDES